MKIISLIIILYILVKVIDAFLFPIVYSLNGDRDLDNISFNNHIPFHR